MSRLHASTRSGVINHVSSHPTFMTIKSSLCVWSVSRALLNVCNLFHVTEVSHATRNRLCFSPAARFSAPHWVRVEAQYGSLIDVLFCSAQIERRMELVRVVSHNTHKKMASCLQGQIGTDAEKRHVRAATRFTHIIMQHISRVTLLLCCSHRKSFRWRLYRRPCRTVGVSWGRSLWLGD